MMWSTGLRRSSFWTRGGGRRAGCFVGLSRHTKITTEKGGCPFGYKRRYTAETDLDAALDAGGQCCDGVA